MKTKPAPASLKPEPQAETHPQTQMEPKPLALRAAIECIAFIRSEGQFRFVRDSEVAAIIDRETGADNLLELVRRAMLNAHNAGILMRRCGGSTVDEKEAQWWKDAEAALLKAKSHS